MSTEPVQSMPDERDGWGVRLILACILTAAVIKGLLWLRDMDQLGSARTSETADEFSPTFYDGNHADPPLGGLAPLRENSSEP